MDGAMRTLGIILAGGKSSRLYPATLVTTKQLLPVYDKPLIYYSLSTLMLAGIREFIIITTPEERENFSALFGNAKKELGIDIHILTQPSPRGIADAFNIVKEYLGKKVYHYTRHALILGDNIFYAGGLTGLLNSVEDDVASIFLYPVQNPSDFGIANVLTASNKLKVWSVQEKPVSPTSNLAITGLYFYPNTVYEYVEYLVPSHRMELEITDLNDLYLQLNKLEAVKLPRGTVWFDTGNPDSLLEASNFVQTIQKHQSFLVGSPHEIAINNGWITAQDILPFIEQCKTTKYGKYLWNLL